MLIALASVALALVLTFIFLNFNVAERRVAHTIEHLYGVDDPQFMRAMGMLLGPTIVGGNRARELINGDEIFPEMLAAIRGAKSTILFETFIYWSGGIGNEFAEALTERAQAGVKVHVLLDWVGSIRVDSTLRHKMRDAGVEVHMFHPLRWYSLGRLNNRTHRKLLIIDGRIGFTGGVGIAPMWTGHAQDEDHWRDCHYRIEGPVVAQMQSVMLANWSKATQRVLHGEEYFPKLEPVGDQHAQMFHSSPSGGSESMLLMYLIAITASKRTLDISSAYFVPDTMARKALLAARERGVRVRILTPGRHTDQSTVRHASRGLWGDLLQADVEIYEYQPTMYHCKLMVVDGCMTSVGSTNFDPRSFHLNDEANLNIYDSSFAERMTKVFEDDLTKAKRITYEAWLRRPWTQKLHEKVSAKFAPFL